MNILYILLVLFFIGCEKVVSPDDLPNLEAQSDSTSSSDEVVSSSSEDEVSSVELSSETASSEEITSSSSVKSTLDSGLVAY